MYWWTTSAPRWTGKGGHIGPEKGGHIGPEKGGHIDQPLQQPASSAQNGCEIMHSVRIYGYFFTYMKIALMICIIISPQIYFSN